MKNSIIRNLYRFLPFMFFFQFLGIISVLCVAGGTGGLDFMGSTGKIRGFNPILTILPFAFVLTILDLIIFPKLTSEEPAMLLFFLEIILNGALTVEILKMLYVL
jgi:hypothetical protein